MISCPSCQTGYEDAATRFCGRCGSDMRRAPQGGGEAGRGAVDPLLGRVIDGRYRILGKIGQGGMGAVYQVEHLAMGKRAAMKLLHPALSADPEIGRRFRREAEAVSRLSNPHTVQVFDFGEADRVMYLVMELVRGEDLGAVLRREGPLPFARARTIVMQACEALAEAHELGVIHRDIKPENLLVSENRRTRDGRDYVKVLDFGLAKLRDSEELSTVTARGALVGTPFYMSPEQIRGDPLDPRSDLYSVGALLYRVLTGEHPFEAPTPFAVLTQHLTEKLVPPSRRRPDLELLPIVDLIVGRAMAKEASDRYPSAEALRLALEEAPHASLPPARSPLERPDPTDASSHLKREDLDRYERGLRRRRWVGLVSLGLVIVLGGLSAALVRWVSRPKAAEVESEPNNSAKEANLLVSDQTVRGHIGAPLGADESDRDFFHFLVDEAPAVLRLDLTGVPTMDLKLEVWNGAGRKIADGDDAGVGGSEIMPNVRLDEAGEYYAAVREVWISGRPATQDETNWYTLRASVRPLAAGEESEPDDAPAQALPLELDVPMRGFLGRTGDVDYFYLRGEGGGTLSGFVTGIDGVDLRVIVLPPRSTSGPPGELPRGAQIFDTGGAGAGEHFSKVAWPQKSAGPILIVARMEPKAAKGNNEPDGSARRSDLVGVDTPYSLTVRLER